MSPELGTSRRSSWARACREELVGADEMGSIMIEENVVSAAGAHNEANERDLRYQISEAGFVPQQRDILYNYVNRDNAAELDTRQSMPLKQLSVAFAD